MPELIGYDACRMASVETVLDVVRNILGATFIGSMVPEPASGWPYVSLLRTLLTGGSTTAVAAAIVEAYAASVDVPDWCMVAVDLDLVGTGAVRARWRGPRSTQPRPRRRAPSTSSTPPRERTPTTTATWWTSVRSCDGCLSRRPAHIPTKCAPGCARPRSPAGPRAAWPAGTGCPCGSACRLCPLGHCWSARRPDATRSWPASPTWAHYFPDL